ncbi:MAG: hypothetical protein HYV27_06370 [Candidatus Hydrogenedentes bacterium]|nr:hypothetical protein [Candidatus Hydrogenedentota bacterium]
MFRTLSLVIIACAVSVAAWAQLPPEAVDLSKLKIPEAQKSTDLCPVHLVPADPKVATWKHDGVTYGGSTPEAQAEFMKDPAKFAEAAKLQRWENNFIQAMSRIWCPVTDQVNPGGLTEWDRLGIKWESCCTFCTQSFAEQDFPAALDRLKARAKEAYTLLAGEYVEGASSPVEGAIAQPGGGAAEAGAACAPVPAWFTSGALQPTWTGGVRTVFEQRCVACHRAGGISPIVFSDYATVRNWIKNMKQSIETGAMPPWPAAQGDLCFSNSTALSQPEKDLLLAWANDRFARGEGQDAPIAAGAGGWAIGEPGAVLTLPEYSLAADVEAVFQEFTIKAPEKDLWIVASEIRPEDEFLVAVVEGGPLGAYYPGNRVQQAPEGTGWRLKAGEEVKVRVRFLKEAGYEATDHTQFALQFADGAGLKPLRQLRLAQDSLSIPAGEANHAVSAALKVDNAMTLRAVLPNMNERGKDLKLSLKKADGSSTTLLEIPHWNPKWRFTYTLAQPLALTPGSTLLLEGHMDNSSMNVNNPDAGAVVGTDANGEVFECWLNCTD